MNISILSNRIQKQIFIVSIFSFLISPAISNAQDDFKPSGNIWGQVFGDYANKAHNDTLQRGGGSVQYKGTNSLNSANAISANNPTPTAVGTQTNAFQIRRALLGYDYQFTPNFSSTIVFANEQNVDAGGKNTFYLKYAFVKWSNIFRLKNTDFIFGQYQTASFATVISGTAVNTDAVWGYRSIERTLIDMHGVDGSTDLGASLQGKLWSQKSGSDTLNPTFIGYALQVGNNNSAVPNASNFKKGRANLFLTTLGRKLTLGVYGDYVVQQLSPYRTDNTTFKFYAIYKTDWFRIGAEVFQQTNKNSDIYRVSSGGIVSATAQNDTSNGVQFGWSVFAASRIIKNKLNVFARYDVYNPDTKYNNNNVYAGVYSGIKGSNLTTATFYTQHFITAGFDWTPNSRFHIMPNIWYNGYKTLANTAGASGTGADLSARVKSDYDLVYRVTFYFTFNSAKKILSNGLDN